MTESELRQKTEDVAAAYETERQRIFREHDEKIAAIRFRTTCLNGLVIAITVALFLLPLIAHALRK